MIKVYTLGKLDILKTLATRDTYKTIKEKNKQKARNNKINNLFK